ncbi:LysE family translocator [Aquirhabdus parva]|uniref:LysE family translocator n=1 Tax=Aquirhabdus parva TaxID=2283318 RepID=A0A345PA63_9GAMM|nr:LysE family translocator [Aquirhabdus parva]AXI04172.1 LysE family translocator [Aquirhabdus parva]
MIELNHWFIFIGAALIMAITPGPNLIYLLSRSICQGRNAAIVSLFGVVTAFLVHMFAAAIGLTALFLTIPIAYIILKWLGAGYLLWLAWQAMRPNAKSPFEARELAPDSRPKLWLMGFMTSFLNPKIAIFYLSILPQFISPQHGSVFAQSLTLGFTQIVVSFMVNLTVILTAAGLARWFALNPLWLLIQRYVMGIVLLGLALRLLIEQRKMA